MIACIIIHDIIIEDKHDLDVPIEDSRKVPTLDIEMTENEAT